MGQPYVGEIRIFAGSFAPYGWEFCNGQLLSISDNEVLFQLIGTNYGGDGETTFAMPNLRGRLPVHQGTGSSGSTYQIGELDGVEQVTLTVLQLPSHNHGLLASGNTAGGSSPAGNVVGQVGAAQIYRELPPSAAMAAQAMGPRGGSQPHSNLQPYLCLNFIISLFGIFPSPT